MTASGTDVLIIGSGLAGLYFALSLPSDLNILIITKGDPKETATRRAQGGIAAALSKDDFWEDHLRDTLQAGAGLCDEQAVRILVSEGVQRMRELIDSGLEFTRDKEGNLHFGKEGGHGRHRVIHVEDHTGRDLHRFLLKKVLELPNVTLQSHRTAIDLITEHHLPNRSHERLHCFGAYLLNEKTGEVKTELARITMLASGGAGQVYPFTTNPIVSTGDGYAMAYRAGCRVRNMEFVQFHPTALYRKVQPAFLISEALRGFGALLKDQKGRRFMPDFHDKAELAPRDIVARAIDTVLKESGDDYVLLDVTHKPAKEIMEHFPHIYETLLHEFKIDITKEAIPVVPAAHYMCGGVITDYDGRTDLKNLYCAGETASTGVHGGNRLASNSLLEAIVFAHRAAVAAREEIRKIHAPPEIPDWDSTRTKPLKDKIIVKHEREEIQKLLWDYVGIVRSEQRLQIAQHRIDRLYEDILHFYRSSNIDRNIIEIRNMGLVAQLIVRSATLRKESRGLHFVKEYPENREPSRNDTILVPEIYALSQKA